MNAEVITKVTTSQAAPSKRRSPSLLSGALKTLRKRPSYFLRSCRGFSLFHLARLSRTLFGLGSEIQLGKNVRLQKNSSLMAERPDAQISIGSDSVIYENAKIEAYARGRISIGESSILGDIKIISRHSITIGRRFLSSWNVFIQDYDSHPIDPLMRADQIDQMISSFKPQFDGGTKSNVESNWDFPGEEISIGDNVWVGANVTILKGAKIGDNCVVATGSVVLRGDYPSG